MAYSSWSVVFGEQPSAAKWNILGTNDSFFNDQVGTNFSSGTTSSVWWEELGRHTLSSAASSMEVAGFGARKYLQLQIIALQTSGQTINDLITFNSDTGNNYSRWSVQDYGAPTSATSAANLAVWVTAGGHDHYTIGNIINIANQEKVGNFHTVARKSPGAANTPGIRENAGKWANTSDQITTVTVTTSGGTGQYDTGSELIVLGHD